MLCCRRILGKFGQSMASWKRHAKLFKLCHSDPLKLRHSKPLKLTSRHICVMTSHLNRKCKETEVDGRTRLMITYDATKMDGAVRWYQQWFPTFSLLQFHDIRALANVASNNAVNVPSIRNSFVNMIG